MKKTQRKSTPRRSLDMWWNTCIKWSQISSQFSLQILICLRCYYKTRPTASFFNTLRGIWISWWNTLPRVWSITSYMVFNECKFRNADSPIEIISLWAKLLLKEKRNKQKMWYQQYDTTNNKEKYKTKYDELIGTRMRCVAQIVF